MNTATVETKAQRITRKVAILNADILTRLNAGEKIIDDHNGRECVVQGVVEFKQDETKNARLCMMIPNNLFCLNPLEIQADGRIHLCRMSIGGNLNAKNCSLEEAAANYDQFGILGQVHTF